jgi:hypothetical protein
VGRLFAHVDRHDHHSDGTYPLAHNPGTSFAVSGPVRFPLGLRLDRRDAELTPWEAAVATPVPALTIPTDTQARHRLHQQLDPVLRQDPECRARHELVRTKIALAMDLIAAAIGRKVPFGVVVFDAWYLAADFIQVVARRRKDGINRRTKNRLLETASVHRRDAHGWTIKLPGPHSALEARVPLIPAHAYRPVTVSAQTSWCFTWAVRIPGLGKVRIVVSVEHEPVMHRAVHVCLAGGVASSSAPHQYSILGGR